MKNTEREIVEKTDKPEGGTVFKKPKEVVRPKVDRPKEKSVREKPKPKPERRSVNESGDSSKPDNKQETPQSSQPKKTNTSKEEIAPPSENTTGASPKPEEEKSSRRRTDNETTDKDKKIRNKDRPAIQIYRPGAKRMTAPKSVSQDSNFDEATRIY